MFPCLGQKLMQVPLARHTVMPFNNWLGKIITDSQHVHWLTTSQMSELAQCTPALTWKLTATLYETSSKGPKKTNTSHFCEKRPTLHIKSGDMDQSHVYVAVTNSADTVFHQRLSLSSAWFTPSTTTRSQHWIRKTPSNTLPPYLIIIQSTGQSNERQGGRTFFLSATFKLYHLSKNCCICFMSAEQIPCITWAHPHT